MKRYFLLYRMFIKMQFQTLSLYRADFIVGLICLLLSFFSTLFAIWAIFQHTNQIGGWDRHQVTFAFGYNLIVTGCSWLLFNQAWSIRDTLVSGHFVKYRVRPINPIFHFFAESIDIRSIVTILLGMTLLVSALGTLPIEISPQWILMLGSLLIASTLLFSGLVVLATGLAFFATVSNPLLGFISSIQGLSHFPASIYSKSLFLLLSTFVPVVFISFFPCTWLLGESVAYGKYFLFTAIIVLVWAVATLLWKYGVQRYELPGT